MSAHTVVPRFSASSVALASVAAILLVGWLDARTGRDLALSFLYVVPVVLATWFGGKWAGLGVAVLASLMYAVADILGGPGHSQSLGWNLTGRFGLYLVAVVVVDRVAHQVRRLLARSHQNEERLGELQSLDWAKSAMMRAAAHDARGPITVILGNALTLARQTTLTPRQRTEALDGIVKSARRLDGMLGDLIDVEQIGLGGVAPRRAWTDLGEVSRGVVAGIRELRGRVVEVRSDGVLSLVDPDRGERIIYNLVRNAALHSGPDAQIWVKIRREGEAALIIVEDSGPGVPDELKDRLFRPFERADGQETQGSGLGLSVVDTFARFHSGRAWVQDRPGGGASFRVLLPDHETSDGTVVPLERTG